MNSKLRLKLSTSFMTMTLALTLAITLTACSGPPEGMVKIPTGEFIMGSNEVDTAGKAIQYGNKKPWFLNEHPEHKVNINDFYIDRYEVTNKQYSAFIKATDHRKPSNWEGGTYDHSMEDHPVTMVSWFDALAFCKWNKKRLPTETEWEKAARGTDGRRFPWGDDFDIKKLNTIGVYGGSSPVGTFKDGTSPYGLFDMAGNVQEWTTDSYKPYAGNDYKDDDFGERFKVVRGGGWGGIGHYGSQVYVRCAQRNIAPPGGTYDDVGFRCAW